MRLEDGFLRWASAEPDLPAVVAGDDRRTYGRLLEEAADLAATIAQTVPGSADDPRRGETARVGVFMERGPDAYTAVLAILLAGAAFVPINPHHPMSRIVRTIELADLDLIVADDAGLAGLIGPLDGFTCPPVLAPWADRPGPGRAGVDRSAEAACFPQAPRPVGPTSEELAYLLFTSGTTGDPKGVPISHDNVTAFLAANLDHYRFGPGDRCSQTFDLTFDLSVFDLFMALSSGACLYTLGSTELLAPVDFVAEHELTSWFSVPAVGVLQQQRRALRPGAMPSLRTSLFCGEALGIEVANAWSAAAPHSLVENLYGPTELTIACSRHRFADPGDPGHRDPDSGLVPIGRPFPAMDAVVVDGEDQLVPIGSEGELCLTGPQRFRGYWRAPEKTADRTLTVDGVDFYRTGDRVFDDGQVLHFVGRLDNQVQVLGHRVELGEVEAAMRSLDDVVEVVAMGLPADQPVVTSLGVAVTLVDGSTADRRSLRRAAAAVLPAYMAPRQVEILDRFPLNDNGKIDRRAVAGASP